jgi:hypothetical protein
LGNRAINELYEFQLQNLLALAATVEQIFSSAGLEYRIAGGLASYFYVEEAAPDAGRLTKDIDVLVRREDLAKILASAESFRFHCDGDMLKRASEPANRRAIHLIFAGGPAPEFGGAVRIGGFSLLPIADLVRMLLTSFRNQDGAHIIDLDEAGLITPEIEAGLSPLLRERLAEARARG